MITKIITWIKLIPELIELVLEIIDLIKSVNEDNAYNDNQSKLSEAKQKKIDVKASELKRKMQR